MERRVFDGTGGQTQQNPSHRFRPQSPPTCAWALPDDCLPSLTPQLFLAETETLALTVQLLV
jgi:hypothetical protein